MSKKELVKGVLSSARLSLLSSVTGCRTVLSDSRWLLTSLPTKESYTVTCPLLSATLGSHLRHSLFHLQLATSPLLDTSIRYDNVLNYDDRERGNDVETDVDHALSEIKALDSSLEEWLKTESSHNNLGNKNVNVGFSMSVVEKGQKFTTFPSTLSREVAFAAHHAMHHLAMMRLIAVGEAVKMEKSSFSSTFGKAPATVVFEKKKKVPKEPSPYSY
jgi:hypothetical protein